jgi:hypothetical protein
MALGIDGIAEILLRGLEFGIADVGFGAKPQERG